MPLSSAEGYDPAASGRPQDDEKTLWEQGLPPSRETNLGTEKGHKNRGPCSNYGICCDAEDNLPPTASSSWQSAQPNSFHPNWGFHSGFLHERRWQEVSVSGPALHLPSLGLSFDPQLPRCRGGLLPSQSEAGAGGPTLMPAGCGRRYTSPLPWCDLIGWGRCCCSHLSPHLVAMGGAGSWSTQAPFPLTC